MKPRSYGIFVVAFMLLGVQGALAQGTPPYVDNGIGRGTGQVHVPGLEGNVLSRTFTAARLTANGQVVGKARTGTIVTTTRTFQELRVQVTGLPANTEFALVVDGTLVGTAQSNERGSLRFRFASPTNGRVPELPEAVRPVATLRTIQVFEVASQRLVASGEFGTTR